MHFHKKKAPAKTGRCHLTFILGLIQKLLNNYFASVIFTIQLMKNHLSLMSAVSKICLAHECGSARGVHEHRRNDLIHLGFAGGHADLLGEGS
jgi:hypothetical protein